MENALLMLVLLAYCSIGGVVQRTINRKAQRICPGYGYIRIVWLLWPIHLIVWHCCQKKRVRALAQLRRNHFIIQELERFIGPPSSN
ncbi:MAG: hypothetical protein WC505_00335 [Patescibacteria group bacterium]